MYRLLILIFIGALVSCGQEQNSTITAQQVRQVPGVIMNSVLHPFSDPARNDSFAIVLTSGDSLLGGHVVFTITRYDGQEIYRQEFPANMLLTYGISYEAPRIEIDSFLKNRVATFFIEENFLSPAIPHNEQFDPEYSEARVWQQIKNDPQAIGFYYLLGEEDGRRIAYLDPEQKVVLYFSCC